MVDRVSVEKRSEIMSKVRSKWTKPERLVHNYLKGRRVRHIMHPNLTGNPDIFLKDSKVVVFIHGCFWHQHVKCKKATIPQQNRPFWEEKLNKNKKRDKRAIKDLRKGGWKVAVLWECELKKEPEMVFKKIEKLIRNG